MKTCSRCGETKDESLFFRDKHMKDGFHSSCKICSKKNKEYQRNYHNNYRKTAKAKKYYSDYSKSKKGKLSLKKYNESDKGKETRKKYISSKNRIKKQNEHHKKFRMKPEYKEYQKLYRKEYYKKRKAEDPIFKLSCLLRGRLYHALKNNKKNGSMVKDLGCSVSELKEYLEKKFKPGMLWENHGEWHVDHIKPLISFDLTDRSQFLLACNFTNLQPLWAKDNLSKGGRY